MNNALWKQVSDALTYSPSEQPVHSKSDVKYPANSNELMDNKKVKNTITTGFKQKQKGSPNKSYPVSVIDKARARLG